MRRRLASRIDSSSSSPSTRKLRIRLSGAAPEDPSSRAGAARATESPSYVPEPFASSSPVHFTPVGAGADLDSDE